MKCCDTRVVPFEVFTDLDYREVSSFFIKNAMGERVYFLTRSRDVAQHTCDQLYGKGHYRVNSGKMSKKPDNESAVGRQNTKSRMNSKGPR